MGWSEEEVLDARRIQTTNLHIRNMTIVSHYVAVYVHATGRT